MARAGKRGDLGASGFVEVAAVFPELHPRFVDGDLDNPSAEFRLEAEPRQGVEGFKYRFLRDFLRIGRVIQYAFGRKIDRTFVGAHEVVKGLMLATADSLNEFRFALVGLCARRSHF